MFILNMRMMAGDSFLSIEKSVLFCYKKGMYSYEKECC